MMQYRPLAARPLCGRRTFLEHSPKLLAKVGSVLVAMDVNCVLHSGLQKFVIGLCGDSKSAVHFAGIFTAVYVLAGHILLLWGLFACSNQFV
jgi:hypothetical protein